MPADRLKRAALAIAMVAAMAGPSAWPALSIPDPAHAPDGTDARMTGATRLSWSTCTGYQGSGQTPPMGPASPPGFHPSAGGALHAVPAPRITLIVADCLGSSRNDDVTDTPTTLVMVLRDLMRDDAAPMTAAPHRADVLALWFTQENVGRAASGVGLPARSARPAPGADAAWMSERAETLAVDWLPLPRRDTRDAYALVIGQDLWTFQLTKAPAEDGLSGASLWADGPGPVGDALGPLRVPLVGGRFVDASLALERAR